MAVIRFLTAGESHGPKLTGILEGIPSGFLLDRSKVDEDLRRRQQGFGRGGRMKIEKDQVRFTAGVVNGHTTGAPIAIEIDNIDFKNWQYKKIPPMTIPRPGHADYVGAIKYDHDDLRISLERASARETAMRCAIGSICKQILQHFNIKVLGYVTQIGSIGDRAQRLSAADHEQAFLNSLENEFALADLSLVQKVHDYINLVMKEKDTVGGVFVTVALNVPPGLGSYVHFDRRLDGLIAQGMMSIPAMKAVSIGDGIKNAELLGTKVHDEFMLQDGNITRNTNRAGGLEGGVSNGMPIVTYTYMKPISTTLTPRNSVDLAKKKPEQTIYERSDFCAVPRAVVIGEAMMSFILLNALYEKVGGDSKKAMQHNFAKLHMGRLEDFCLKDEPWSFDYLL